LPKYFVWISGLRGPEAQIWDEKDRYANQKKVETLFKQELHPSEHLIGLNGLKERYPAPVSEAKP
jgi:hypothetical protein